MKNNFDVVDKNRNPLERLDNYITDAKKIFERFKFPFHWEENKWNGFCTFKSLKDEDSKPNKLTYMNEKFCDFSKAIIIHKHILNPSKSYTALIAALRLLEFSLNKKCNCADVCLINEDVFDYAYQRAKKLYKRNTVFQISVNLEKISEIIFQKGFLNKHYFCWKNKTRQPSPELYESFECLISPEGKLSGLKSIEALAAIFAKDDCLLSEQDLFTSSVFALLMCAPSRITEILSLPFDCELCSEDHNGVMRYGLRLFSLKGYGANIKWIPTIMVPIAKKAIMRLKKLSENARKLAKELECNNFENKSSAIKYGLAKGFKPEQFNALCLQHKYCFSSKRKTDYFSLRVANAVEFNNDISCYNKNNIFARHKYYDSENKSLFVNSHQARHLLNTIAYLGGMTDFDIARWSGRKNVSQNNSYNHVSQEHAMDFMENIPEGLSENDTLLDLKNNKEECVKEPDLDFDQSHGAFMIMDNGYCEHDYAMAPCGKYPGFDKNNKFLKEKFEYLIKTSDKDSSSGVYGADKWANEELIFKTCKL
ncbi:hypothetical protein [Pantoea sp. SGAir0175]